MAYAVVGPLYTAAKDMVSYMSNKAEYVRRLEQNLTYLTMEIATLNSRKVEADRKLEMSAATMEKSGEYNVLIAQINMLCKDLEGFITKYAKRTGHSSTGNILSQISFPHLNDSVVNSIIDSLQAIKPKKWSSQFRRLGNLSEDVERLCTYANLINNRLKPENLIVDSIPQVVIFQDDFFNLRQFDKLYIDRIMKHLEEENVKRIAVLGPIGVGKSTVMKMLNNRFTNSCSSKLSPDYVIWINLPTKQDDAVEAIQDKILSRLKATCRNTVDKKGIISALLSEKKYILLIDQVSSHVDLDSLGIHQDHKFGKVVVASCNKKAIERMKIDRNVEIRRLSEKEAIDFFETSCKIKDGILREIALKIIKLCDGLPLVIYLVASYLRHAESEGLWRNVKRILKLDPKPNRVKDLVKVGEAHEKVYKELVGDSTKMCSVYGAMFPAEYKIDKDYLIECWLAEHFLDDYHMQRSIRAARDCGDAIVEELTARYLLERFFHDRGEYVKMSFYFRKVALQHEEIRRRMKTISLILSQLKSVKTTDSSSDFPGSLECNDLQALFLSNSDLSELGVSFLKSMKNLRILDLHRTGIKSLPDSIRYLCSLINLYLNGCSHLKTLPPQESNYPKKLQLLDIRGTSIRPWLPPVVGSIKSLRCLRVSFDEKKCNPDPNENSKIITKLEQLEELIIETDFSECWKHIAGPIADVIANLEQLSTLHFNFPDVHSLKKFTNMSRSWKKLRSNFRFFVGFKKDENQDNHGTLATWQLLVPSDREYSSVACHEVKEQARALTLMGDRPSVKNLGEYQFKEWKEVKVIYIQDSDCLESIVDSSAPCVLANLVQLHLCNLKSLRCILKGSAIPEGSLSNLTVLNICQCPQLKQVLNLTLSKALSSLKYLKVEDCLDIGTVVKAESPDESQSHQEINPDMFDIFQKLEKIELVDLPQLQCICDGITIMWSSSIIIGIERCPQLTNLPFTPANVRELISIECANVPNSLVRGFHNEGEISGSANPENPLEVSHGTGTERIPGEEMLTYHDAQRPENWNLDSNGTETNASATTLEEQNMRNSCNHLVGVRIRVPLHQRMARYFNMHSLFGHKT